MRLTRLGAAGVGSARAGLVALAALFGASSCGPGAFLPQSLVNGVRILASSASEPFAQPGDSVTMTVLTADGRPTASPAATVSWIPLVCEDPTSDLYYDCFAASGDGGVLLAADGAALADAGTGDGGGLSDGASADDGGEGASDATVPTMTNGPPNAPTLSGGFGSLPTGVDLTPFLPNGPSFTFTMPSDTITRHGATPGTHPYGLVILFNAICAGHLEFTARTTSGPQGGIPLGCYDENHVALDSQSFVFGLSRVYAYTDLTNANPVIDSAAYAGAPIDFTVGVTMPHCTAAHDKDCPEQDFAVNVPAASWELNPDDVDPATGAARHEEIYAAYFATFGQMDDDIRLLYDTQAGKVTDTEEKFRAPHLVGDGTMWIVVHDNRGGAAWVSFPVHVT